MHTRFQEIGCRLIDCFARSFYLTPCPIEKSGNGIEYKNHLSKTVFTVYHDRLDKNNNQFIELAIGLDNIADEIGCLRSDLYTWYTEFAPENFHPAASKPPQNWPRISLWSEDEVEKFCSEYKSLFEHNRFTSESKALTTKRAAEEDALGGPPEKILKEIDARRGQRGFRASLLKAYDGRCAVSGCSDIEVLEAAHIFPHSENEDYRTKNGFLLRADLHTLFDLNLISINPSTGEVVVSSSLSSTYQVFSGVRISLPHSLEDYPDASALLRRFQAWEKLENSKV